MTDFRALCAELVDVSDNPSPPQYKADVLNRARAALKAKPEPVGPGPTDEELLGIEDLQTDWNAQADAFNSWDELGIDEIVCWAQRQALARWGRFAIEPVPVSERLPGPEDCDGEGWCWMYEPDGVWWQVLIDAPSIMPSLTHWLPHWALPVPKSEVSQ